MREVTVVFWYAIVICIIIVLWGAVAPANLESITTTVTAFIADEFGWYYMLVFIVMLVICLFLVFSRYGNIKLGKKEDEPEFSLLSWFALLFGAGMGIGLVFFTTAEPISHAFISSPGGELGTDRAILEAMQYTSFHWGIHGWSIYGIVALILAYFKYKKDAPGLISATLTPLFGKKVMSGIAGKLIDTLAVFATVVGVASTLGFGSAQINGGLSFLFNVPKTFWVQVVILAIATVLFIASSWSGIGRGIKYLSNINMAIAILLVAILFIVGPTTYILNMFTTTLGAYGSNFLDMSFNLKPLNEQGRAWINNWTIFYWAWWISWAPFVGMFIARVSKGRKIKEFVIGVLLAPTFVTIIFFSVFGVSALNVEQHRLAKLSELPTELTTFGMLEHYQLGGILSLFTIIAIVIFFVTSADSATFVLGMLSTSGRINPANVVKIVWGLALSTMAAIVYYSGGIQGFQNLLIITALPFSFIIILMAASFIKVVKKEK